MNALLAGEIDFIEAPPHDLLPLGLRRRQRQVLSTGTRSGNQYTFRPNWLHKPFDNPKVRQALLYAFNQEDFLKAVIGDRRLLQAVQGSYFPCGTTLLQREGHGGPAEVELQEGAGAA